MKRILFFILLLPLNAFSQVSISALGGVLYSNTNTSFDFHKHGMFNGYGSIKAQYILEKFSFGVRMDIYSTKNKYDIPNDIINQDIKNNPYYKGMMPAYAPSLFAEYQNHNFFVGANFGLALSNKAESFGKTFYYNILAISFGIQAGYNIPISKHLFITPEISPRFLIDSKENLNTFCFPISAGITYKF